MRDNQTTLSLPPETLARARAIAALDETAVSELIGRLVAAEAERRGVGLPGVHIEPIDLDETRYISFALRGLPQIIINATAAEKLATAIETASRDGGAHDVRVGATMAAVVKRVGRGLAFALTDGRQTDKIGMSHALAAEIVALIRKAL